MNVSPLASNDYEKKGKRFDKEGPRFITYKGDAYPWRAEEIVSEGTEFHPAPYGAG